MTDLPIGIPAPDTAMRGAVPAAGEEPVAWIETAKLQDLAEDNKPKQVWLFQRGDAASGIERTALYAAPSPALRDADVDRLKAQLAECYRLSGADPDGNEDWRLAPYAVDEVRRLRAESDASDARAVRADADLSRAHDALRGLLRYAERQECPHETTHRGGAIWTICDDCGKKWADDEGGFKSYLEPPAFDAARAALADAPAPAPAPEGRETEPTQEMVQVGVEALRTDNVRDSSLQGRVVRIYRAMRSAAPSVPIEEGREAIDTAWEDLVEKTDRTSPEDYPDHALITREELADYMALAVRAALARRPV